MLQKEKLSTVSLDTFHSVRQNISNYLDAWFTFLSSDAPEDILNLIEAYPEFKEYYHDIALFRKNPKELMNMYSEALVQMDKNTANYMIEEMQKELDELNSQVDSWKQALSEKKDELSAAQSELAQKEAYIKELEAKLGIHTP